MANLSGFVKQLKKERDRVRKQLLGFETALTAFAIAYSGSTPSRKPRKLSAKSRAKIAAAQRARWAKVSGNAKVAPKRAMSASSRRKIAAAQTARWAKFRSKKKD
jgi:ABC-type phosphate transport system substrate-binding protein